MKKPGTISKEREIKPAQNLKLLLDKGIGYVQKFSGEVWTDYNSHDPGVTILEQYCYGLTELGYKTAFPIEDLLADPSDGRINWEKNSFYSPALVFSSHPYSITDFRKLLIDTFSEIQNCWVSPVFSQGAEERINGVYQIEVLPSLSFQKKLRKSADSKIMFLEKLMDFLSQNRNLGEDFDPPTLLYPNEILLEAKIEMAEELDVDQIMAEIIFALEVYLYHPVVFSNMKELQEQGERLEDIFNGPRLTRGFIKDSELKERGEVLHVEKFIQLISKVSGVRKTWDLVLNQDKKVKTVKTPKGSYASINTDSNDSESVFSTLEIYINGNRQRLNKSRISDFLLDLWSKNFRMYQEDLFMDSFLESNLKGRFRNPGNYHSIQHHFPGIYGLSKNGVSSHEPLERHARVRQLKGYLMLMERHLANFLAQLAHLSDFFDPMPTSYQGSYYAQDFETKIDKDELELKAIFQAGFNTEGINPQTGEKRASWLKRKNRVLDHLLARFGEEVNDQPFQLSLKLNLFGNEEEMLAFLLLQKSRMLQLIPDLNYGKHRANFEFPGDKNSRSVLEKLLHFLLGILSKIGPLTPEFSPNYVEDQNFTGSALLVKPKSTYAELKDRFRPLTKKEKHFPSDELISKPEISFGKIGIKDLYLKTIDPEYYWISKSKTKSGVFEVIFKKSEANWVSVWEGVNEDKAIEAIAEAINYFRSLNFKSEGMYLIDHIRLRSLVDEGDFGFEIRDEWGMATFKSIWVNSFSERDRLLSDFYTASTDSKSYRMDGDEVCLYALTGEKIAVYSNVGKMDLKEIIESNVNLSLMMSGDLSITGHLSLMELERLRFKGTLHSQGVFRQRSVVLLRKLDTGDIVSEDFFDLKASIILPDWPARFQESHFRYFLEREVRERIPAHMEVSIHWLNIREFKSFEEIYLDWVSNLGVRNRNKSARLYNFLKGMKGGGDAS